MEHGNPEEEYIKGIEFCESSELNEGERKICLDALFDKLKRFHSDSKISELCRSGGGTFFAYCRDRSIVQ